jgi:NAD(P)-dependent dehydrogenase (short-subunit alcohol dehydrogenase family)
MSSKRLGGKVAIVTGAATGLGRETATLYAEEGARVVVADFREPEGQDTVERIRAAGGDACFVQADVSSRDDIKDLIAQAESRYGALHIMTANAGILGPSMGKRLGEISEEEIEEVMAVNFWGVVHSLKYAIDPIRRAGGGAMTVTTSIASHFGYPDLPAYTVSKHAVLGLVRSLSADVGPEIRVNAVSAGSMVTEIRTHAVEAQSAGRESGTAAATATTTRAGAKTSQYRGDPRQVAFAHLFLVSDEASFVSGQALMVDGGRTTPAPR